MKVHILRLVDLNVDADLILWIRVFLSCRPPRVCVNGTLSGEAVIFTGFKQGSVVSPLLFFLILFIFMNSYDYNFKLIKYADDMALVCLLQRMDSSCETSYLVHLKLLPSGLTDKL